MRNKKYNLLELQHDKQEWTPLKSEFWPEDKKQKYEMSKLAVDMYINDASCEDIFHATGIRNNRLTILVERCLKINPETGKQFGYAALVPNKKIDNKIIHKERNSATKNKGSFRALLTDYPQLGRFIQDTYFGNTQSVLEKKISPANLHKRFLAECRRLHIQSYEYPFNTADKARRTFYAYLKQLDVEYVNQAMKRENANAQQKFFSTGIGESYRINPLCPYSMVQIDGHKIDMLYTVEVKNRHDEIIRMPAIRMWLIAVVDVSTRVVIGYTLTSNENYNQTDVLRAIRNTIMPKVPIQFSLNGLQYPDNYGYPSLAIPEVEWAMPDTIMLDNAKSHLAENVVKKLCAGLRCSLNYGSVATPETRGIVERLFRTLEENGYHRMVSTTGSNISDVKRVDAEKDAVKYQITDKDITQLTEYLIAIYNNSPHTALDNETPLECMNRRIIEAGMQPYIADTEMKRHVYELLNITELKTIRGSVENGKRPYITYKGTVYRNDILAQSVGLIGKKLIIEVNPDDISTIKGYFEDGTELGILTAVGEWGRKSHSLKTREEALKLANRNKQNHNPFYALLTELENELNKRAKRDRRARSKAARIRKEQGRELSTKETEASTNVKITEITRRDNKNTSNDLSLQKQRESYTTEELAAIMNAKSLHEAYKNGLI